LHRAAVRTVCEVRNHLQTEGKGFRNIVGGIGSYVAGNFSLRFRLALKPHLAIARGLGAITVGEYASFVFARPSSSCSL
jgi:hypothetical protein